MKNSVSIRIGAVADTVSFKGGKYDGGHFDRAKMKAGLSGKERAEIDTNFADAICDHVGIKERRRDRRANKYKDKDRRRGE